MAKFKVTVEEKREVVILETDDYQQALDATYTPGEFYKNGLPLDKIGDTFLYDEDGTVLEHGM